MEETPINWTWTPITPDDELVGERAPASEELRFDERWLAPGAARHADQRRHPSRLPA